MDGILSDPNSTTAAVQLGELASGSPVRQAFLSDATQGTTRITRVLRHLI